MTVPNDPHDTPHDPSREGTAPLAVPGGQEETRRSRTSLGEDGALSFDEDGEGTSPPGGRPPGGQEL